MVLLPPPCPMAEFAIPRHSAVMERLRRRIELCRRHHSTCEARYEAVSPERLELERQHTFALHQRCLQAKAKRAGKHRQPAPPAPAPTAAPPAPAPAPVAAVEGSDSSAAEQNRTSSALIAQLHESVKRNRDSAGSPQNGEQQNGYGEMFSVHKKPRHDDTLGVSVSSNGMPPLSPLPHLDKSSGGDALQPNGKHSLGLDSINKKCLPDSSLHSNGSSNANDSFQISLNKEMKQEPVDDLPCMISGTGGSMSQNNLMPDLNLNEQEWKELIDELNRSVPDEDMKDLFNEDFEEKKDTETSSSATQTPLPQDINIKTEFSPATFEQEQLGSPQVRSTSSGQTFIGSSSVAVSTASPVIGTSQTGFQASSQPGTENPNQTMMQAASQSQNVQRPLANVLLPGQGSGGNKEMSSAHQLQQIAAKQKRDQMLQNQQQTQQVHQPGQMANWPPSGPSHSPLAVPYSVENPTSPSVYQQDFNNQKLMMSTMTNKSSPRTGGTYLQPSHVGLLTHQPNTLNQNSVAGQGSMLDYGNTKPLSHYKADCGQVSGQNKAPMLTYLPQQLPHMNEEQNALYMLKPKPGNIPYRPLVPHSQDQNPSNVPRAPVSVPASSVGTQPPAVSMANTHGTAAYLNTQQQAAAAAAAAAAMKQHQLLLDQQKQREQQQKQLQQQQQQHFLIGQRQQQLLAEQEKQRQEQQFQRHLTRPPPQYQEQNQTTYQQVGQFTGSSAAMAGVSSLGPSNSGSPRMFPQMQIGPGHGSVSSIPSNPSQQDRSVAQYSGTQNLQRGNLYSVAPGMAPMVPQHAPQASNGHAHMPRQPSVGQSNAVSASYGQNALGNAGLPPQHSKGALNPTLSKPSLPRVPAAVGPQNPSWQHQGVPSMNSQPQAGSGGGPFPATSTFHMQQPHLKMPSQQFPQGGPQVNLGTNRPMTSINSSVSGPMMSSMSTQQRTNTSAQPQVPAQQVLPGMNSAVPDLTAFSQNPSQQLANRASMHCGQGYQVRTANQELPFTYSAPPSNSGLQNITGDTDLIDSLLKNRTSEEWINDLDELLGTH